MMIVMITNCEGDAELYGACVSCVVWCVCEVYRAEQKCVESSGEELRMEGGVRS